MTLAGATSPTAPQLPSGAHGCVTMCTADAGTSNLNGRLLFSFGMRARAEAGWCASWLWSGSLLERWPRDKLLT
eukprot:9427-Eustigmatos_ZCMA.PRE.1